MECEWAAHLATMTAELKECSKAVQMVAPMAVDLAGKSVARMVVCSVLRLVDWRVVQSVAH